MSSERSGHTLEPTALVHEAYLRLVGADVDWQGRAHFIGVAARAMRQILINHAIARGTQKRGAGRAPVPLDEAVIAYESRSLDLLELNDALKKLAEFDPDRCRIVEYRFFGGLTMPEIAELTSRDVNEIQEDWRFARAWLRSQLHGRVNGQSGRE
jgi:RNA polymerase sigma factor (TIGR02999 family)